MRWLLLPHLHLPSTETVTPLGLRQSYRNGAPCRLGPESDLNREMLSPPENAEKPTAPPPHQSPLSYYLYGLLTFSVPHRLGRREGSHGHLRLLSCPPTSVNTSRDYQAYLSTSWQRCHRHHATRIAGTGAPLESATSRDLRGSSPSDHLETTLHRPALVLAPWPVTYHRADGDFRTEIGSARVGLSPLIKDSVHLELLLLSLSNRSFAARQLSADLV
jgi:hypothetical protein